MIKNIKRSSKFDKDLKRCKKRDKDFKKREEVTHILAQGKNLPRTKRPHKLSGNYKDWQECHIEPDWLLIYRIDATTLYLARTGTHTDLFG